jgi:hypothetical protein
MPDSRTRLLRQLLRSGEELATLAALAWELLADHMPSRAELLVELRSEERRWRARAADDAAAARVAELFSALADVFEAPDRPGERPARGARDTRRKFDPPPGRWDTRAPWRS